jgi:F0F1-type ATP synthase delta subunit
MIDSNTPASVKVRAAEAIFNHAAKAIEIEDIEARVSELERAAEASKPGNTRSR